MTYWDIKESIRKQLDEGHSWEFCVDELEAAIPGLTPRRAGEIVHEVLVERGARIEDL